MRASIPSRFLAEIPGDLIEAAAGSQSEPGETRRYEPDPEFSSGYDYTRARAAYGWDRYNRPSPSRSSGSRPSYGRSSPPPAAKPLKSKDPLVGKRVRHPKYGIGTVIEVDGEGEDRRLTVSFQDYGPKKLIERYAHLQLA